MEQPQHPSPQQPELEHKDGAIKAAVWCNEGANGPFRTVKLSGSTKTLKATGSGLKDSGFKTCRLWVASPTTSTSKSPRWPRTGSAPPRDGQQPVVSGRDSSFTHSF